MKKIIMMKMTLAVFGLVLLCSIGASAQKTDCSTRTDAEIVKAIYDKMEAKHSGEVIHVNVVVKSDVVTLQGWATTKKARNKIEKIAKKTSCDKRVINQLEIGGSGGCNAGYKKCGGACIPDSETCNICTARTCN